MFKHAGTLAAALLLSPLQCLAAESADEYWVASSALDCVLDNLDAYLDASDKDPLLIFMDICPTVSPPADRVLAHASNSLPQIRRASAPATVSNVLVARRFELRCIKDMRARGELPKPEARGTPATLARKVSFERCPAPAKQETQNK